MSDLTRAEQHLVARTVGASLIAAMAAEPSRTRAQLDWVISTIGGGTLELDGVHGWFQIGSKGVGWSEDIANHTAPPSAYARFVRWERIVAHVDQRRTPALAQRCSEYRRDIDQHNRSGRMYPGQWPGVPFVVPRNEHGQTREEVRQWSYEVHHPEWRALLARSKALVEEILPLLVDDEPVDLLELLALT